MAATYDPTTDRGMTRLLVADTNVTAAIWSDAEVDAMLSRFTTPELAGAMLLESEAADRARIAVRTQLQGFETENRTVQWVQTQAARLRKIAPSPLRNNPPDQIWSLDTNSGTILGTTHLW